MPEKSKDLDAIHQIRAGKFRRYHGETFLQHLADIGTILENIRDFFYLLIGMVQSVLLLRREQPDLVFIKGGFVGVPIGLGCASLRIPFITHDSDALPGLANRIVGRWASMHLVGMPKDLYQYPADKTEFVGVPIGQQYHKVSAADKKAYRQELGIPQDAQVLCITGGSLGSRRVNEAFLPVVLAMIEANDKLYVLHQTGSDESVYKETSRRIIENKFVDNLHAYTGAADVVVTRAGATNISEVATQARATVLVPNPQLTGGHQLQNARQLANKNAVVVITEEEMFNTEQTAKKLQVLLQDKEQQAQLSKTLHEVAATNATERIAEILLERLNAKEAQE